MHQKVLDLIIALPIGLLLGTLINIVWDLSIKFKDGFKKAWNKDNN